MPSRRRPPPTPGKHAPQKTPAELAKVVVDRAEPVVGDPNRVKLKLTIVLSRAPAEQLGARALASEDQTFDELVREILEPAASDRAPARPSRR
jgi:hypothetical protein